MGTSVNWQTASLQKKNTLGSSPSVPARKIMKKFKKSKILFGSPVALLSLEAYFGMVAGYFAAYFFSPRIKSITFNIGKRKFHMHHWIWGLGILPIIISYKISPVSMPLTFGFFGGIIFQGIFCYSDWHKILIKRKKIN